MWNHALFMWMPTVDNFLTNNFWLSLQNLHTWKNVTFLFNKFSMKYILIYNDTKKKKNPRISLFLNRCIWIVSENLCWQGSWLTDLAYCTVIPWKHLAWAWSSVEEWQGTLFFNFFYVNALFRLIITCLAFVCTACILRSLHTFKIPSIPFGKRILMARGIANYTVTLWKEYLKQYNDRLLLITEEE